MKRIATLLLCLFSVVQNHSFTFIDSSIMEPKRKSRRLAEANDRKKRGFRQQLASMVSSLSSSTTTTTTTGTTLSEENNPRFSIGVIADIQHAPIDDGYSFSGIKRYYRHALEVAQHAACHFERDQVELVLNLGDICDGKNVLETNMENAGEVTVRNVMKALSHYTGKILHAYGNHCLYNLDRSRLGELLGIPFVQEPCGDLVGYHSHSHKGFRFITIDGYDIALMRRCPKTSQKYHQAVEIMSKENPNFPTQENSPAGLSGLKRRFVGFNGAVGEIQLKWLRERLEQARQDSEKVIILSHQPILPGSSSPVCLIWNYNDVLKVLREFSDIVVASFAGHAHRGGYKRDRISGIHFRVFEAVLENPHPHRTYAILDLYDHQLVIRGYGNCTSGTFDFEHLKEDYR